jgi:acetamidase/formamidase
MQIIKRRESQKYAFDNRDEPALHVIEGEIFQVETDDALSGMIDDDSDDPFIQGFDGKHFSELAKATPGLFNPVVGPIHIKGCKAGDVLAVHIDWVDPWRYGFSGILPRIGPLGDSLRYQDCADGHVQVIEHLAGPSGFTRDGTAKYSENLSWPLEPFIGTLATAPEREVFTSVLGQGPFGGNIDCRDICAGHTIYLNSYNDGGLLYIGDVHGGQGDTEFTGIADETRATVQLSCTVIPNKRNPCVRIEKPDSIVAVGINLPMEHAVYDATDNLMQWLADEYDVPPKDLYIRMSCDPAFRIRTYQMVRLQTIQHVVGAEYPKSRLFNAIDSPTKVNS